MPKEVTIPVLKVRIGRFLFLLLTLVLLMTVQPFLNEWAAADLLMNVFVPLMLLSGVYAVSGRRRTGLAGALILLPAFLCQILAHATGKPELLSVTKALDAAFLMLVTAVILRHLFRAGQVTADTVIGSICAYLLIGFVWAFVFALLETALPGSFNPGPPAASRLRDFYYFSFVTLTTLGYGDIVPVSAEARSLAVVEAAMGQIYIAVLVARLVGLHIAGGGRAGESGGSRP